MFSLILALLLADPDAEARAHLILAFAFTARAEVVAPPPPPPPPPPAEHTLTVAAARDRAAREGRVLLVWVGRKDEALAARLPASWVQAGPVAEYGGERGPGVAVGVPHAGSLYYRGVVPATLESMQKEVRRLSPAPFGVQTPPRRNC